MVYNISEETCMVCSKKINIDEHPLGLVFEDKHFVCEDCCSEHSSEEIFNWTKSVMNSSETGMPIGLWLIHEQNKDKTMMSSMKK